MNISVVIVDDHPVISHGLLHVLGKCDDLDILGNAKDAASALKLIEQTQPDVIILDISLEGRDGISLMPDISERCRTARVIMYTMHNNKHYIIRSLKAGALGYMLKSDKTEELVTAIRNVSAYRIHLSTAIDPSIIAELITADTIPGAEITSTLTPREYEVVSMIAQGRTIDDIADDLCISPKTVRVHRTNIMHKFSCKNIHELLLELPRFFPKKNQ